MTWTGGDPLTLNDKPWGPGYPVLAPLASGGFVLLFGDSSADDYWEPGFPLRFQLFSASGAKLGDEVEIETVKDGSIHGFTVAALPSGGFVVAFTQTARHPDEDPGEDLWMQMFDASGSAVGDRIVVNTLTHSHQYQPEIAVFESGGFVIVWDDAGGNWPTQTGGVKAQLFDPAGAKLGGEFPVPPAAVIVQSGPATAALPDGGFVVAWEQWDPDGQIIVAQRFDSEGDRVGGAFEVADAGDGYRFDPEVTVLADGELAFTWTWTNGYNDPALRTARIEGQLFDVSGAKLGGVITVSDELAGDRRSSNVVALPDGGFAVTWHDSTGDGSEGAILGRIFNPAGGRAGDAIVVNVPTAGDQRAPAAALLDSGDLVVAWGDYGGDTPGNTSTIGLRLFSPPPADAREDAFVTDEATAVVGNLFSDNGAGADSAPVGATLRVTAVNGSAAGVGEPIALSSGALLTLRADGTFSYDPNHAFDHLAGYFTGGSNARAEDSFSYALAGRDSATVTVTVWGLVSPDHRVEGTEGENGLGGSAVEDLIYGLGGNDLIYAGEGNDRIDGGAGADLMEGAAGDDLYIVDNARDRIVEIAGGGIDTARSSVDYALSEEVEHLILTGGGNIRGTGNALANTITGNNGNNRLDGRAGADAMAGGKGHDTYVVDHVADQVVEGGSSGNDAVESSVSYRLPVHFEKLTLTGNLGYDGRGNAGANTITGNSGGNLLSGGSGNDVIDGGAGNDDLLGSLGADRLNGGGGDDRFFFNTAPDAANADRILDFSPADDAFYLLRSVFTGTGPNGTLAVSAFHQGSAAADAGDRILYDAASGNIFYDRDGTGAAAAILFATVTPGTALTHADFIIYG